MVLILRAITLCVVSEVVYRLLGPRQNLLVVMIVLVYSDAYYWRHEKMNGVLGFLCPVAMCLLMTTEHTMCSPRTEHTPTRWPLNGVYWTLQVLWPLTAAYYVAGVIFKFQKPREFVFVSLWTAFLAIHCGLLLGGYQTTGEIMLRSMIYYMFGMLFFHSKSRIDNIDRNTHNFMSMHVGLHLFFVDVYIMMPNVIVLCSLLWYVFFGRKWAGAKVTATHVTQSTVQPDEELLSQLRAAKTKSIA